MATNWRHDMFSASWHEYSPFIFHQYHVLCFCDTDDRFRAHSQLAESHLELVDRKAWIASLPPGLTFAMLRRKAGGYEALCNFLFFQPQNNCTLLQIRSESESSHRGLPFRLTMSHPHGRHLVCCSTLRSTRDVALPTAGCHANTRLVLTASVLHVWIWRIAIKLNRHTSL